MVRAKNGFWQAIAMQISEQLNIDFQLRQQQAVGGGCIHFAHIISDGQQKFFVKSNDADYLAMFSSEATGLKRMADTQTLLIPDVIATGIADNQAFLVLSAFETGEATTGAMRQFGQNLAEMHRHQQHLFGFEENNYIGTTPQINTPTETWLAFWQQRLRYQFNLAKKNGGHFLQAEELIDTLEKFFVGYQPVASLLHGDLWSGNYAINTQGHALLFDPACYFGDRETDIAMTELFGGFSPDFYQGYQSTWALDKNYHYRKPLYTLYHVLNHFNLFGGGYFSQAKHLLKQLLQSEPLT